MGEITIHSHRLPAAAQTLAPRSPARLSLVRNPSAVIPSTFIIVKLCQMILTINLFPQLSFVAGYRSLQLGDGAADRSQPDPAASFSNGRALGTCSQFTNY